MRFFRELCGFSPIFFVERDTILHFFKKVEIPGIRIYPKLALPMSFLEFYVKIRRCGAFFRRFPSLRMPV